jgi:hypothetical protein
MDSTTLVTEWNALATERPGRLRAVLIARLRAVGGSVDAAATRAGVSRATFLRFLRTVGATDAPETTRAETIVELPRSSTFDRWFRATG